MSEEKKKGYVPKELKSTVKYIPMNIRPDIYMQEVQLKFGAEKGFYMFTQLKLFLAEKDYHFIRLEEVTSIWCKLYLKSDKQQVAELFELLTDIGFFVVELLDNFGVYFSIDFVKELWEPYRSKLRNYRGMTKQLFPSLVVSLARANGVLHVQSGSLHVQMYDLQCGNRLILDNNRLNEIISD